MASTYTLNNGIELIGTGEQSGTWGETTNTNLELIDTALDGQISLTLSSAGSSGSPNTLPVADGASSNGRNRLISYVDSGDLGATAYVQLTPNDAEKIIYIRNALSGSRSIIVFQGTYNASNDYEVPAGTTAVVYFNGGGTGAVAANVFNNAYFDGLRLGSVSVTAILDEDNMASNSATALSTQQSIKAYVDSQVGTVDTLSEILANGNTTGGTDLAVSTGDDITFADSSKAIFGAGSDLQIYSDGSYSYLQEGSGTSGIRITSDNQVAIRKHDNEDIAVFNIDGAVRFYHDNAQKFSTTSTGVTITGVSAATSYTGDGSTLSKVTTKTSATGSSVVAAGTTAQRDGSPSAGMLRFNSTATSFEGYDGSAWGSIGGGASGGGSDSVFYENDQSVTTSYTIPATKNAMSTGPITVDAGATVTVSDGARYVVI
tara:strand:+ start:431 stop:1723 length:1293 start_codon:yes stop_codon:yes gene_type:complete